MPDRDGTQVWRWLGPVLLASLMAIGGAAVQRVFSDRGIEARVRAIEGQLREHGSILAGPNGVTVQLTEIRQALRQCGERPRASAAGDGLPARLSRRVSEAP